MNLPSDSYKFLNGSSFSSTCQLNFEFDPDDFQLFSRIDWLTKIIKDKNIIHVGCVDHDIGTIKKKIDKAQWLHAELDKSSSRCLGIDINQQGVDYLKNELGYPDTEAINILTEKSPSIINSHWDYLILGEVVEHIDNPVEFLSIIRTHYKSNIDKILVTVPNAFAMKNFKHAKKGQERINSDHRFWFTPFTICKLLTISGYKIERLRTCGGNKEKLRSFLKNRELRRNPLLRNGLIIEAEF